LGLGVLQPGGVLVLASCSSRVSSAAFVTVVTEAAAQSGRPLQIFAQRAHPIDHPIGFPEGAYLKCLYATA
jgi:23S rRNA (cytosine1962-C5)-methyltransferase